MANSATVLRKNLSKWGGNVTKAAHDVKFSDDIRLHAWQWRESPQKLNGLLLESRCAGIFTFRLMAFTMGLQENGERYFRTKFLHLECRKNQGQTKEKELTHSEVIKD